MKESFRINGESLIVPIPKPKKDQSVPANYRPISLTSVICKVTERIINNRLLDYLERIPSFGRIQCGGLKGRSTTDHFVQMESAISRPLLMMIALYRCLWILKKRTISPGGMGSYKTFAILDYEGDFPLS